MSSEEVLRQTVYELRKVAAWLDLILGNLNQGVLVVDEGWLVQYANDAFAQLVSQHRIFLLGKPIWDLLPQLKPLLSSQSNLNIDDTDLSISGRQYTFDISITAVIPKLKQRAVFFYDVTKRKMLEQELQKQKRTLQEQVLERSKELEKVYARTFQAEKMAAVGQLAAGVAHEINNPLAVILGFSQSISRLLKTGDALELPVKSIEREATRCKNLVGDLLVFSRLDTVAKRVPVNLNQSIEGALSLLKANVKMSSVEIKTNLTPDLPDILANNGQIQQMIVNLANNATDAMPKGGGLGIFTGTVEDGSGSWVTLKISDTGFGIPTEIQSKIFEPFFTTKPVGKGTGLGLSLVHEIVQKNSGTIDVQSRPGFTEFYVKFPAIPPKTLKA